MITEHVPTDWRDLQRAVGDVLEECGFLVKVEHVLQTVRGATEVDVYAEEVIRGRKSIVLCECKHWKARVPQNVVHGFRTTMADTGANIGYIVGSSGFQAGAFAAVESTNVKLLTWTEFQAEFEHQWIDAHFVPQVGKRFDEFLRWTEPLPPTAGRPLTSSEAQQFWELWRSFQPLVALLMPFAPWMRLMGHDLEYPSLPLRGDKFAVLPKDVLQARGYRELFDRVDVHARAAVAALKAAAYAG
ncbi:restriction endonuclease [Nocardioides cavernae]|uniref:Restriction endonuclease n=1 Tax=Nocardioides cavernae TaxID=1921566 RepID=A0ABR8N806_9ACTN|nr:restriction endonuclease [Nocardioides cavernae]MBD3924283.1 restriction endonuclease [Nocardioides cavernae]MBM7510775.1 hypothetical protein [Nocardioides cavernae]